MVTRLLGEVGMEEFRERFVKVLSGGQKRRLALAMELVSSPPILLCDEVTSGLDPQSEDEIVSLLHKVAKEGNRLVISVTHSLKHIASYDAVIVLYKGVLSYAGKPDHLCHYFRIDDPNMVYGQLESRDPEGWHSSWKKHATAYINGKEGEDASITASRVHCPECRAECPAGILFCNRCGCRMSGIRGGRGEDVSETSEKSSHPGAISQFSTLVQRRLRIFFRSHAQIWLQAGLVFGFPCMVAIFGWNGLPQIRNLNMGLDLNVIQQLTEARDFLVQASKVGSLVSGIVMFEVILLTLMGANNSGREIASERQIFEKEKLSGLSSFAYVASKVLFLGILSAIQSLWMGLFIHFTCAFPGIFPRSFFFFSLSTPQ